MSNENNIKTWHIALPFITLLFVGGMAWGTATAQTKNNNDKIAAVELEQKNLENKFDDVQQTVTEIRTNQQNMKEDMSEIKADLKLLLRRIGDN